jgi:hypothetical protein
MCKPTRTHYIHMVGSHTCIAYTVRVQHGRTLPHVSLAHPLSHRADTHARTRPRPRSFPSCDRAATCCRHGRCRPNPPSLLAGSAPSLSTLVNPLIWFVFLALSCPSRMASILLLCRRRYCFGRLGPPSAPPCCATLSNRPSPLDPRGHSAVVQLPATPTANPSLGSPAWFPRLPHLRLLPRWPQLPRRRLRLLQRPPESCFDDLTVSLDHGLGCGVSSASPLPFLVQ